VLRETPGVEVEYVEALDAATLSPVTSVERPILLAIAAPRGSREAALNGAAARKGEPGDLIMVAAFAALDEDAARRHVPTIVQVDAHNRLRPTARTATSGRA